MKKLFLLLSLFSFLFANEEPDEFEGIEVSKEHILDKRENYFLTNTDNKITPKVNPVTGEYYDEVLDFIVAGAETLSVRRFYNHLAPYDARYASWRYNPEAFLYANLEFSLQENFAAIGDADGSVCSLKRSAGDYYRFDFEPPVGFISSSMDGRSHPSNKYLKFWKIYDPKDKHRFEYRGSIKDGSGKERYFNAPMHRWTHYVHYTAKKGNRLAGAETKWIVYPNAWTPYHIPIDEERLPNGNILTYSWTMWKDSKKNYPIPLLLSSIVAYNHNKTKILGSVQFHYSRTKQDDVCGITLIGSDGRKAYIEHAFGPQTLLWSARYPNQPSIDYGYEKGFLSRVEGPDQRVLTTSYYPNNKVAAQYASVGPKGEMCPIGRYEYLDKTTVVYDAENHKTIYHFDDGKRITAIDRYGSKGLLRRDAFEFDKKGNLTCKKVEDGSGKALQISEYRYDSNQNPIEEKTGDGKVWQTITRTYSQDGFNLKLSESDRVGKKVCYRYRPGTNLLESELTYEGDKIRKRTFHTYDDCAICIQTIADDGLSENPNDLRGITYRKIIEIQPKYTLPCFGMAEIVSEKTLDQTGKETLLHKTVYTYTPCGKVKKEEHYDAAHVLRYTLHFTFDGLERLISQTDALGNKTNFCYDRNHNLICKKGPRADLHVEMDYDLANRLTQLRELQSDGSTLITKRKYDRLSQLISQIDPCGNETFFSYDALGKVTSTSYPDGAREHREFDALGNPLVEVDARGYHTRTSFNFRGQPLSVFYPDDSEEHFTYYPWGQVATHTDRLGSKTCYEYDIFDHPVRQETYDLAGNLINSVTATYSPFCKLTETDGEGVTTFFTYDFAGRKISEEAGPKKIGFSYDALGRLVETDFGAYKEIQDYDLAGQLIEKRIEEKELQFHERYAYDEAGNKIHRVRADGIFQTVYNTQGKPLYEIDPLGAKTTYQYIFGKDRSETHTNPLDVQTVRIFDAFDREKEIHKKDKKGNLLAKTQNSYDLNGNLIDQIHFVYSDATLIKIVKHHWDYGPMNRIEKFIEGGIAQTCHYFNNKGQEVMLVKPSGKQIHSEYDAFGRPSRMYSSDFDYKYSYDRADRLVSIYDAFSKKETRRSYNALGCLIDETLANKLKLKNSYDSLGRRTSCVLHDGSSIHYLYCGAYLAKVCRNNSSFVYDKRDLNGYMIEAILPHQLGKLEIVRDSLSRLTKCRSPFYRACCSYDLAGNCTSCQFEDSLGKDVRNYAYDPLDQLIEENGLSYQFDSLHNRLKKNDEKQEFNSLCQIENGLYQYDPDGNLIFDGEWTYTYDSLDRLLSSQKGETKITYEYDPFHRRLSKKTETPEGVKTLFYLWDKENEIGVVDAKGQILELRVLGEGLGAEIGSAVLYELNGNSYVPLHDHQGSIVVLIDPQTKKQESYRYTAFGVPLTPNKRSPWRFSSKRVDEETGLVYFGRRYYCPTVGTWITKDPLGLQAGPNLYAYLKNCPLTYVDLYGLYPLEFTNPFNLFGIAGGLMNYFGFGLPREYHTFEDSYFNKSKSFSLNKDFGYQFAEMPVGRCCFCNGVGNSFSDLQEKAFFLSEMAGSYNIHGVYNATHGLFTDSHEAFMNLNHINTPPVKKFHEQWDSYFSNDKSGAPLLQILHSQATPQARNALETYPPEKRNRIHIVSIAPFTYIDPKLCGRVTHYVCDSDPITYIDFVGRQRYKETIIHIKNDPSCKQWCHEFMHPIYREHIDNELKNYKDLLIRKYVR